MMLEAVEARFGGIRAPRPVEWLSDNGSIYTARETRVFATQLDASKNPCVTRALMIHCVRNGDGADHGAGTGAV